jgi:hypothetical protein
MNIITTYVVMVAWIAVGLGSEVGHGAAANYVVGARLGSDVGHGTIMVSSAVGSRLGSDVGHGTYVNIAAVGARLASEVGPRTVMVNSSGARLGSEVD